MGAVDWQVQQAKQRVSEALRQAERDGAEDHGAVKELLLAGRGLELPAIERDPAPARVVEL